MITVNTHFTIFSNVVKKTIFPQTQEIQVLQVTSLTFFFVFKIMIELIYMLAII